MSVQLKHILETSRDWIHLAQVNSYKSLIELVHAVTGELPSWDECLEAGERFFEFGDLSFTYRVDLQSMKFDTFMRAH